MIITVGVHGFAGSGKDTFADALVENYGFTKIAFADPLRDVLIDVDPVITIEQDRPVVLSDLVNAHGWDEAKALYPGIRTMMVRLGEAMRNRVDRRVWIDAALRRAEGHKRVVFSDVRHLNEARLLKDLLGAKLVHIIRPGTGPANEQEASNILPSDLFYFTVVNNADITMLRAHADMLMSRLAYFNDTQASYWTRS